MLKTSTGLMTKSKLLMTENKELLEQLEVLGGLYYDADAVAKILALPLASVKTMLHVESSAEYNAYWRGYYTANKKLREEIKKSAEFGSSPAQTLMMKLIDEFKANSV